MTQACSKLARAAVVLAVLAAGRDARAVGESSTRFNVYAPGMHNNYHPYGYMGLYITATGNGVDGVTTVDVWDMPADNCPVELCDSFGVIASGSAGSISNGNEFHASGVDFTKPTFPVGAWNWPTQRFLVIRDYDGAGSHRVFTATVNSPTSLTLDATPGCPTRPASPSPLPDRATSTTASRV